MSRLPVIIGFGGVNPAGRSSSHHGYRRLILDSLGTTEANETLASLAALTGQLRQENTRWLDADGNRVDPTTHLKKLEPSLKSSTLIRKLENGLFDPDRLLSHKRAVLHPDGDQPLTFVVRRQHLPDLIPMNWQISDAGDGMLRVEVPGETEILLPGTRPSTVNSAGQLPAGFDPTALYQSRNHPRGLQLTVVGASDAINSLGISWEQVMARVAPDQVSVYAGSSMSQLDYEGNGGMLQARLLGKRVTSKQLALGFAEMPADFINAYLLGNLGTTGTNVAACATFLYNLRQGLQDIRSGTHRIAIVGTAEAPITPEIIDGYATMGALATDEALLALDADKGLKTPDHTRACRPFGLNAGFTLGESAQFVVLCDDALALELGASIHGAVNDVFVNADGYKKSISSPGVGNYITMAKAAAVTANVIGEDGLRQRSFVQAHGTGTPQNRTTESHILSEVAKVWGIENWPVTALKSYIGHSLASASADQLVASLGVWKYGIIPGILSTDAIAEDVYQDGLSFLLQHHETGPAGMDAVILNAKGFGGNNASASVLAPHVVEAMLARKHGKQAMTGWRRRNAKTVEAAADYDRAARAGRNDVIYRFDNNVLDGTDLTISRNKLLLKGHSRPVDLAIKNPYVDFCD